ncbi:hypothetical protein RRG08_006160 [Elysia crispata]|uniref:Uncharacterized protein n=1 Tax=Elysia crispata TaxID=231223 RepID=A0AAE1AYY9_9GAST|nr:hypothetical protein RRG08_006160 [Elysia crispata]
MATGIVGAFSLMKVAVTSQRSLHQRPESQTTSRFDRAIRRSLNQLRSTGVAKTGPIRLCHAVVTMTLSGVVSVACGPPPGAWIDKPHVARGTVA